MRFLFLAIFCSVFHCNLDGFLPNVKSNNSVASSVSTKAKKGRKSVDFYDNTKVGTVLDEIDGVAVYFNGPISNVNGRNTTADGYNLGLKYQCVEFVKRYYYQHYRHKMPNAYGHAKEFFDYSLKGHGYNRQRALTQHPNGGVVKPQKGDLLVFNGNSDNPYGHVGIISKVGTDFVEIIQQNVAKSTRATYRLQNYGSYYNIEDQDIAGWLRKS